MPRLKIAAVRDLMAKKNIATKFELSQLCGVAYGRLRELLEGVNDRVNEDDLDRLCRCLGCDREEIAKGANDPR